MNDRIPGRLVVIALVNLYAGFACTMAGLAISPLSPGALTALGGLLGMSVLPLIIFAIILRLSDPRRHHSRRGEES